jgi:NAD(P)-dependent dehydrogenase (short-subunit alcohol dehydrogenase family)
MSALDGKVAIVTGAGRGIGRGEALALAAEGAKVVVNDFEGARELVQQAIDTFGGLDVLVNNAGFLRDRMLVNATEDEWDAVIRVHLKGHFAPLRHAAAYWRDEAKAGRTRQARIINTSSGAGLQGSIAQGTYSAAKAGIAGLTLVAAAELGRYGVTVNALAPAARTRMTEAAFADTMAKPEDGFDAMDPTNVAPLVAWLASVDSGDVTGRVIESEGGKLCVEHGWRHGEVIDIGRRWDPADVGDAVRKLIAAGPTPEPVYGT